MRYPPILAPAILGAALALAPIAPAAAEAPAAVNVKFSDLDLSTAAGQAQLERRVDKAARSVCGLDDIVVGTRISSSEAQRCYAETKINFNERVAAAIARGNSRG